MLIVDDIRKKLITQRRELFQEVAKTEEDLRWLHSDIETEVEERGQEETMAGCSIVWMGERKPRSRRSTGRFSSWGLNSMADVSDAERPSRSQGWMWFPRLPCVWLANSRRRPRRR